MRIPGDAFLLHRALNLPSHVVVFDYSAACSGFIGGLYLAYSLMRAGHEHVLLVNADTYSYLMGWDETDRENRLLFGDGEAVTKLRPKVGSAPIYLYTDGKGALDFQINLLTDTLEMNGKGILEFVMREVPLLVREIVRRDNSTMDDIDLFVFHQASKVTLDFLFKKLKIPPEKQFTNLERIGNTVSASIPIALRDAELQGRLHNGMKVLIAGFGSGLSWGGCIIDW